ncbi:beta-lactamase family protein [Luteibacter aegosomaticola]|uniref:serine hydrolase domain-containing protein n=1 Tax=Luteibacter aegosomaticola TaxID=2911538 RepID=UPI001FF9D48D|nr:serine hydrolase domain-containing protein [Luteibacter aegosomaticola]UPG90618.1 beta-lactamase family protein [Luteibacter aegosomaticola]
MMSTTRHALGRLALAASLATGATGALATEAPEAAQRHAIENGLRPKIDIAGQAPVRWNVYERMRRYRVPTMSVAVIKQGRIAWSATYRSDGTVSVPATRERFQAASLSKGVTGSLAATLADQHLIDLDAPIDTCLAPLKLPPGKQDVTHPVTLRNLLHHTAGATVNGFPGYPAGTPTATPEQVILGQPPSNTPAVTIESTPGSTYAYSGGGYTVAQLAIAHCTKQPFAELIQRVVLKPAGMDDSSFAQPLPPGIAHASGHTANGDVIPGGANTYPELAAAGLWTTAEDLARWLIAVRQGDRGEKAFFSKAAAALMLEPGLNHYGLGVFVSGDGLTRHFMHEGGNAGFKSKYVMYLDSGDGVVMLTDSDNGRWLNVEFTKAVADAFGWEGFAPRVVAKGELNKAAMEARVGRYAIDDEDYEGDRQITLAREGDAWFLVLPDTARTALVPTGANTFVAPDLGYAVSLDPSGGLTVGTLHARPL